MIYEVDIQDILIFTGSPKSNPRGANIVSNFLLNQSLHISPIRANLVQKLTFADSIKIRYSIKNVSLFDNFHLESNLAKGPLAQIVDFLSLSHRVDIVKYDSLTQTLIFSQTTEAYTNKATSSTITFTDTVDYTTVKGRSIVQTLVFQSLAAAYIESCEFIATGTLALSSLNHITLTYDTLSIQLKNPEFGDSEGVEVSKINRKSRSGDPIIYRDPNWPKSRIKRYQFAYLSEAKAKALLDFFDQTLGRKITLIDYEGRSWEGFIRTPSTNVIQQGRASYSAEFEFEI